MVKGPVLHTLHRHVQTDQNVIRLVITQLVSVCHHEVIHGLLALNKPIALGIKIKAVWSIAHELADIAHIFLVLVLVGEERVHEGPTSLTSQNESRPLVRVGNLGVLFQTFRQRRKNHRKLDLRLPHVGMAVWDQVD